jgi:hypothetical protein
MSDTLIRLRLMRAEHAHPASEFEHREGDFVRAFTFEREQEWTYEWT